MLVLHGSSNQVPQRYESVRKNQPRATPKTVRAGRMTGAFSLIQKGGSQ